ncbi:uncharacterized protein [Physcomitrium patens]|uniref:uncharacterized protein isoform X2 n=1 Tax=Physcomitrium patens TaxID=3218 RepID=UPI003CCE2A52
MSSHCTRSGVYGSVQDQGNALIAKDHCSRVSKLCDGSPSYNLHLLDGSSCHFLPQSGACLVDELDKVTGVVENDPARFSVDAAEIERWRKWSS